MQVHKFRGSPFTSFASTQAHREVNDATREQATNEAGETTEIRIE
jgi:hypothetical protein